MPYLFRFLSCKVYTFIFALIWFSNVNSQVRIGEPANPPDQSAILELESADRGFLLPRISDTTTISNPAEGLMIYDMASKCMRYYNSIEWSDCLGNIGLVWTCGDTLIDSRDGQKYATILIGNQCWFKQNLNIGTRIDGAVLQTDNGIIEKYCYQDLPASCDTFGGLYVWDELMTYDSMESIQGICPVGWHVPSDDEIKTMELFIGIPANEIDNIGYRGTDEGSKIAGNEPLWSDGLLDMDASFGSLGLDILPAGGRYNNGFFAAKNEFGIFFSSTQSTSHPQSAYIRYPDHQHTQINRSRGNRVNGWAVRCIQD